MPITVSLNELSAEIHHWAIGRGFWKHEFLGAKAAWDGSDIHPIPNPSIYEEKLMLVVSECSEVLEARRDKDEKLEEEEVADIIIRALDYSAARGFNIEEAISKKMLKNHQRPHLHGRAR